MEDLQRELIAERIKNRDLNQTISDMLERMEEMEKNIMRNDEKITENQLSLFQLTRDVETLATIGHWCGEQDRWNTGGTITYDSITFSASNNMNYATTPLDINTGINSHNYYYYLDIDICHISGIFTVPVSGAWRLTYSLESRVDSGESNWAFLYINGQ